MKTPKHPAIIEFPPAHVASRSGQVRPKMLARAMSQVLNCLLPQRRANAIETPKEEFLRELRSLEPGQMRRYLACATTYPKSDFSFSQALDLTKEYTIEQVVSLLKETPERVLLSKPAFTSALVLRLLDHGAEALKSRDRKVEGEVIADLLD